MTKNQIISQLFTGRSFNDCINKMEPDHLREDLRQEVIAIICELPEQKVIKLHADKALEFYVVRVIINQIQSSTSDFFKKYRRVFTPFELLNLPTLFRDDFEYHPDGRIRRILDRQDETLQLTDADEIEARLALEAREERVNDELAQLDWYSRELLDLYLKVGSYRAIEKKTNIPFTSAYQSIQKTLKHLRCQISK